MGTCEMTAAARYAARIAEIREQQARLVAADDGRWDRMASYFRQDPRREPEPNLTRIAELVGAEDVVVDVGGGAGRVSLPLALRCREAINVDPSPGMCEQFEASAREAGIENARAVTAGWMDAGDVRGDVVMAFNVTYFVDDIVPFVEKLSEAARTRVVIGVWSDPPPNRDAQLFEVLTGEPKVRHPGHPELLPVLWEMGILPDVTVLEEARAPRMEPATTREEAVEAALQQMRLRDGETARARLEENFDNFYRSTERGFQPTFGRGAREMLITWETG